MPFGAAQRRGFRVEHEVATGLAELIVQRLQELEASINEAGAIVALLPGSARTCKGTAIPDGFPTVMGRRKFNTAFKSLLPDIKPNFSAIRSACVDMRGHACCARCMHAQKQTHTHTHAHAGAGAGAGAGAAAAEAQLVCTCTPPPQVSDVS